MATRKRSKARLALFLLAGLALVLLLCEGGSFAVFYFLGSRSFSYAELDQQRASIMRGFELRETTDGLEANAQAANAQSVVHPYVGYVYNTAQNSPEFTEFHKHPVNALGFIDSGSSVQKRSPDKLIVGITGGSVAYWLSAHGDAVLSAKLREHPSFRDKRVHLVRLGLGGFKQPQQLMTLNYCLALGGEFDIVINLDGFNEVALPKTEAAERGVFPLFPRNWDFLVPRSIDRDLLKLVGRLEIFHEERKDLAAAYTGPLASRLITLQLIWKARDRLLRAEVATATQAIHAFKQQDQPFLATGPGASGFSGDRLYTRMADAWLRCSVQMDRICRANGARYFHFLQPNQYVEGSKPIGAAERKVAITEQHPYRIGVIKGYPALVARAEDLSLAGVRFFDLRMLFKDITQQLYIDDCCHLNREGNAILARAIASAVCEAVDLESATLAGIRVQHTTMVLDDPMVRQPIRVIGTFDDDKERLVSVAHAGTRYSSSDPSVVTVSADGMLQARRQGHARIRVHNGPFETQVEVVSRWRPVLSFGVGSPGNGGQTPVLAAEGEPRVGNQDFKLRISNVVGGAKGFLLVADHLAPPRENPFGAVLVSPSWPKVAIQANGPNGRPGAGTLVHPLPIPNNPAFRGRTTYLQAVFTDEDAAHQRSATNGLRVTVQ